MRALLLLLAPRAVGAGYGWVSISDLDFSKCKPGDDHQSFSVESIDGGSGTITDAATGRCLAVKECTGSDANLNLCSSTCELTGTHKVVVLDACSSSSDGCGGKSQQWTTKKDASGVLQFNSALNKAGAGEMCLNAAGDPTAVEGFSFIVWGCGAAGPPNQNQWFHYDADSGALTTEAPGKPADGCTGLGCCLTAKPCIAPCTLPMGWGGHFILALAALCSSYLLVSMVYMGRLEQLDLGDVRTFSPHGAQIAALAGLVRDGFTFSFGAYAVATSRSKSSLAAAPLLTETKEEEAARTARETAEAALREKQKPAKVGKGRAALHEVAMVGDAAKLKKILAAELQAKGGGGKSGSKGSSKVLDQGDQRGYTAYHHACAGGHEECVKLLIKAGCDTLRTADSGATGWQLASKGGKAGVVAMLQKVGGRGKHARLALEAAALEAAAAEEAAAVAATRLGHTAVR